MCLPYDNKLTTEVSSQIQRHSDGLSYHDRAPVIANHDMGVQAKLLLFLRVQTCFFFFGPALLSLFLLQSHCFDMEQLPLGLSCSVLHTSGLTDNTVPCISTLLVLKGGEWLHKEQINVGGCRKDIDGGCPLTYPGGVGCRSATMSEDE